jgi:hypothetical protein
VQALKPEAPVALLLSWIFALSNPLRTKLEPIEISAGDLALPR